MGGTAQVIWEACHDQRRRKVCWGCLSDRGCSTADWSGKDHNGLQGRKIVLALNEVSRGMPEAERSGKGLYKIVYAGTGQAVKFCVGLGAPDYL